MEQVPGDNQGDDGDEGSDEQLPRPEVALQEERNGGEKGADDAADGLRSEMQDNTRHETAKADEQTLIGTIALREDACEAHGRTTHAAGKANEHPHHQDNVLVERAATGAFIVFVEEIHHQRRADKGNAQPQPRTPVLMPYHQSEKLQEEHDGRRITPRQKEVFASRLVLTSHFSTDAVDDVEFGFLHW